MIRQSLLVNGTHLFRKGEDLSLIDATELRVHFQVFFIESLDDSDRPH